MYIHRRIHLDFILLALVVVLVTGCVSTSRIKHIETLQKGDVLLMPLDVELSTVTVSGILEPNAEWTTNAEKNIESALTEILQEHGVKLVKYEVNTVDPKLYEEHIQLIKLHQAIGSMIFQTGLSFGQGQNQCPALSPQTSQAPPTQQDRLEWSLGPTVTTLRETYNADYALFLFVRDSYTSAGRVALIIIAGAIGYSGIEGGAQNGFASLVDLHSGKIVWFNQMLRPLAGDLRTPDKARESVEALLETFPK